MTGSKMVFLSDQGGSRSGIERRLFSYTVHIPERRLGDDRRSDPDRRRGQDRRSGRNRREPTDFIAGISKSYGTDRRGFMERRAAFA